MAARVQDDDWAEEGEEAEYGEDNEFGEEDEAASAYADDAEATEDAEDVVEAEKRTCCKTDQGMRQELRMEYGGAERHAKVARAAPTWDAVNDDVPAREQLQGWSAARRQVRFSGRGTQQQQAQRQINATALRQTPTPPHPLPQTRFPPRIRPRLPPPAMGCPAHGRPSRRPPPAHDFLEETRETEARVFGKNKICTKKPEDSVLDLKQLV